MKCPTCGKPTREERRPFCSKRCADIDLGNWLTETYSFPSREPDDLETAARKLNKILKDAERAKLPN